MIKQNLALRYFLVLTAIWVMVVLAAYTTTEKGELELWLNQQHHATADVFFKYWTHVGDGAMYVLIVVGLAVFHSYRAAIYLLLVALCQTLFVQIPKLVFFPDAPRPKSFFGETVTLHFVEGVEVHAWNSFPSGHTATAFAIACSLCIIWGSTKNTGWWGIGLFSIAFLVAFSRVYLLQHFFIDTAVGAFLGMVSALLVQAFLVPWLHTAKWHQSLLHQKR